MKFIHKSISFQIYLKYFKSTIKHYVSQSGIFIFYIIQFSNKISVDKIIKICILVSTRYPKLKKKLKTGVEYHKKISVDTQNPTLKMTHFPRFRD